MAMVVVKEVCLVLFSMMLGPCDATDPRADLKFYNASDCSGPTWRVVSIPQHYNNKVPSACVNGTLEQTRHDEHGYHVTHQIGFRWDSCHGANLTQAVYTPGCTTYVEDGVLSMNKTALYNGECVNAYGEEKVFVQLEGWLGVAPRCAAVPSRRWGSCSDPGTEERKVVLVFLLWLLVLVVVVVVLVVAGSQRALAQPAPAV
jgi:hypothetical protein